LLLLLLLLLLVMRTNATSFKYFDEMKAVMHTGLVGWCPEMVLMHTLAGV